MNDRQRRTKLDAVREWQYRVAAGDKIVVEKIDGDAGSTVSLGDILLAGEGSDLQDVSGLTVSAEIIAQVEAISRRASLDVGGIEYLVDDRDGHHYFYDVNALSNFVADPVNVIGFDPWERLVDYLEGRVARGEGRATPTLATEFSTLTPHPSAL